MANHLTTPAYWNRFYTGQDRIVPADPASWKALPERDIFALKCRHGVQTGRVLELGGGASPWLAYLAPRFPDAGYVCLDFAEEGVRRLRTWAAETGVANLEVVQGDFFAPPPIGTFDFVFSHGVVEHFTDLPGVLRAHADFMTPGGRMLTIIPNMAGVLGWLTRGMNRPVYDLHVPHDLASLRDGHRWAGLDLVESGYLCSNHFGVLSSCVSRPSGFVFQLYKALSRLSKAVWLAEDRLGRLPATRFFAPYIYAVSRWPAPDPHGAAGSTRAPGARDNGAGARPTRAAERA